MLPALLATTGTVTTVHTHMHTNTHIRTHVHARMHTNTHIRAWYHRAHAHKHTHTYACARTHTHTLKSHIITYRVIPDRWKGMSPAQIEEVRRTQKFQREEKQVHTTLPTPAVDVVCSK